MNAKDYYLQQFSEQPKTQTYNADLNEIGSRANDLSASEDGKLSNEDNITIETYKKMRKDPQVKACLLALKLPILQLDWSMHADTDGGKEIAAWIEQRLYESEDTMQYYLREILTAIDFGFSVTEKMWQIKSVPMNPDGSNMQNMITLQKLRTYDPKSLTFKLDATYKLEGVLQAQKSGEDKFIAAEKLLIYSHEKEFGNLYGESALKAAYKPWVIKEFLQKFWNIALERYGTPLQSMKMPQGESIKKAIALMDLVKDKSGIPLPDGYELEIHNLSNAGMSFKEAIEYQDTQIARAMLVPDLVFGNTGGGAYALSKTHANMFLLRLNGITQEVADVWTSYLIRPLVQYNFGDVPEIPLLKFADVAEENMEQLTSLITEMITGNVIAPQEGWIRERLGLPQADDEAREYLDSRIKQPASQPADDEAEDPNEPDEPKPGKKGKPGAGKQDFTEDPLFLNYVDDIRRNIIGLQGMVANG